MQFSMSFKITKFSKWLFLILGLLIIGSGVFIYYLKYKESAAEQATRQEKKYDMPLYTIWQDNKAKLVAYDPKAKKNFEIFSLDWKNKDLRNFFYADYSSAKDQIVYSDEDGISIYNIVDKKKTRLLENKKGSGTERMDSISYIDPKWSQDSTKIVYKIIGYESMAFSMMDADGKNVTKIEGEGYNLVWNPEGSKFALGSEAGMGTGPGLNVSLADPITKTKQVLPTKEMRDVSSLVWLDKIYFSGKVTADTNPTYTYEICAINPDGTGFKSLNKDEYDNQNIVNDTNILYFTEVIHEQAGGLKSNGIYRISTEGEGKELFYQDGDRYLVTQLAGNDYIGIKSSNNGSSYEAINNLLLVEKNTKEVISVAEGANLNFIGIIKSNKLPEGLSEIEAPKATKEELDAYALSIKTKGFLYRTYYDYCWDYDCSSATYPYPKLQQSKTPEIINLSEKPEALYGDVKVPVIFAYDTTTFSDEQITLLKRNDLRGTYGYFEKWVNDQAKAANIPLNFTLDYKTSSQIQMDDSCVTTQGSNRILDAKCMKEKITATFPDLSNSRTTLIALSRDNNKSQYTWYVSYSYSENNIVYSSFSDYDLKQPISDFEQYFSKGYGGVNYYSAKQFITQFGGRDRTATYKKAADNAEGICYTEEKNDVMCGAYWSDESKKTTQYINLDTAIFSDVTKKELGWYDQDGDGKNEIVDKCPFNKNNNCQ